jgi:hypothetical protein
MQWGGYSRVPSSGLDAADPPISTPQLYVVAVHHLGGFSKGFLIILAGYGCRDAFNVIVPRQGIKPILWHVDLLFFPNRPIEAEIFSADERRKNLREKNLPANVRDLTFRMVGLGAAGTLAGGAARGPKLRWDSASVMRPFLRI